MFNIFVQLENDNWVAFLPLAIEFGYVSQEEADYIKDYSLDKVAEVISYFGNEVQILPTCINWKVVGPVGYALPNFVQSTYEIAP